MIVKSFFLPKEPIQIEIYILNNINKKQNEYQIIRKILRLICGEINFEIEIEIKILIMPIELLLSCKNYKLEYINDNYYLKTNKLVSKEKLIFDIQNH